MVDQYSRKPFFSVPDVVINTGGSEEFKATSLTAPTLFVFFYISRSTHCSFLIKLVHGTVMFNHVTQMLQTNQSVLNKRGLGQHLNLKLANYLSTVIIRCVL